jgi:hypothetical protein
MGHSGGMCYNGSAGRGSPRPKRIRVDLDPFPTRVVLALTAVGNKSVFYPE